METKKLKQLFCVKKFFNSSRDFSPARMLLSFQCAGLPLLGAMMALMGFANTGGRRVFYIAITASLAVLMLAAILFNIKGHYRISAGITAAMAIAAPWLCMLFDRGRQCRACNDIHRRIRSAKKRNHRGGAALGCGQGAVRCQAVRPELRDGICPVAFNAT